MATTGQCSQLLGINPVLTERNFFGTSHLQALAFLQRGDEAGRLQRSKNLVKDMVNTDLPVRQAQAEGVA